MMDIDYTIDELDKIGLGRDVGILSKLPGTTIAKWSRGWDVERRLYKEFYDIKTISSVELEVSPNKMVVVKFMDGTKDIFLNLDQTSKYVGKIGEYGSIHEYLECKGLSIFG